MTTTPEPARPPALLGYCLTLGFVFVIALLGFAAVRARDGRRPVTDWLDPLLAGATLLAILAVLLTVIVLWPRLPATRTRRFAAGAVVSAEWLLISGEIVSNTITIGEPPGDIGALLEFGSGAAIATGVAALLAGLFAPARRHPAATTAVTALALILAAATAWWFTHPIDQATAGTPACVAGNALYNAVHGGDC